MGFEFSYFRQRKETVMSGYQTDKPCDVCNEVDENEVESWFGTTTCKTHRDIPPACIRQARWDHLLGVPGKRR